jgi:hypothetical protein
MFVTRARKCGSNFLKKYFLFKNILKLFLTLLILNKKY